MCRSLLFWAIFALFALYVQASPVNNFNEQLKYKTLLSDLVQRMHDQHFEILTTSKVIGHSFNYSLYAKIFKRDDEYSIEMHRQSGWVGFHDKIVGKGTSALYYEYVMDRFWCNRHPFRPLDQEVVDKIKEYVQNGQIIIQDGSTEELTKCRFVNQENNINLDFQVKEGFEVSLLKATANNFLMPQMNVTITGPTFPLEITNDKFEIDDCCKYASDSDSPVYHFLEVL